MAEKTTAANPADPVARQGHQKFDLRLYADIAPEVGSEGISDRLLEIFGRWRLEEGEELMDLADYAHIPEGPGILLVGHRWQFGIDWAGSESSLFYSSRKGLSGDLTARLSQALGGLFQKSVRLLSESSMSSGVTPRTGELEIVFNDRLTFPNTDVGDATARPAVDAVVAKLYDSAPSVVREADTGKRLAYRVHSQQAPQSIEALSHRLGIS